MPDSTSCDALVIGVCDAGTPLDPQYLEGRDIFVSHALLAGLSSDATILRRDTSSVDLLVSSSKPIAYLVTGPGFVGDRIVADLSQRVAVTSMLHGQPQRWPASSFVIDALDIASAHAESPFDAGKFGWDGASALVVCNWHSEEIRDQATAAIVELRPDAELPDHDVLEPVIVPGIDEPAESASFFGLQRIIAALRAPSGCPWDREQDHSSLVASMIDEVQEFADATASENWSAAANELGDVLFGLVMQTQIGHENGTYTMNDVIREATAKLIRRHPHVFGDVQVDSAEDVVAIWNAVKQQERERDSDEA